jgi:hypothetical protein
MKFTKVTRGVLFILPTRPFPLFAKSAFIAVANLGKKAIVRLTRLKPTGEWEIIHHHHHRHHLADLATVERTNEGFFGHTAVEHDKGPGDCKGAPAVALTRLAQFDRVGLKLGCGFLSWPVPASS